jgi:CubicO group peptidase (beta-lactamase class C family)
LTRPDVDAVVARVRAYLDERGQELVAPGVQVALTDRERTLAVICHGLANADARTPVEPEHRFQIGSISKGFTAMALLQEQEAGRLDLLAPVTDYLPWLEIPSPYPPITIHHLLSHTSGLIQGTDFTTEAAHEVWSLRELEPGFAPGERFWYSNDAYKALGLILERLTGRPWFEVVHERVMTPAGMAAAAPVITHDVRPSLAAGYAATFDDRPWQPSHGLAPATWSESGTADGTICASADELAGYVRLLLNRGGGVLAPDSFDLMSRPVAADEDSPGEVYGYGLKWLDGRLLGHSGSTLGYVAYAACEPATGFGVAICANGIGPRLSLARFTLETLATAARGGSLPDVPEGPDPARVPDADRFVGEFGGPEGRLVVTAEGERLALDRSGHLARLLPFGVGASGGFLIEDRDLDRFILRFELDDEGNVEAADHGPDRYLPAGRPERETPDFPRALGRYLGHYRNHNPWTSNIRVFARGGRLWLQDVDLDDVRYHERPLEPRSDGTFRVGEPWSPDRIRFDTPIDSRATRAVYDGAPFYRTFTP